MTNRKETKIISKILNTMFSNNKFLSDLCNLCNNNYNSILFALGDIMEYYITSRDQRILSVEEMNVVVGLFKYVGKNKEYKIFNNKKNEENIDTIKRNIIKDGYMTRTINSFFLKRVLKYGLGHKNNIDNNFNKRIEYLENVFGIKDNVQNEIIENNQFCMSTPGTNIFYQAASNSPKRFFLGILGQKEEELLPVEVSESKTSYFKRVFDKKVLSITLDKKIRRKTLKIGYKLIKDLCTYLPTILLIPIESNKYDLKVTRELNNTYDLMPINDWIFLKLLEESPMNFFARDFDKANEDLAKIISYDSIIPSKELGIIKVPDRFQLVQIIAHNKGYKNRSKISYLTAEQIK